jgi:hypothetical protein
MWYSNWTPFIAQPNLKVMRSTNQDMKFEYHNLWYSTNIKSNVECDIQIWYLDVFGYLPNTCVHHTMSTLGALTIFILFVKMLKSFRICFFKEQSFVKQNRESFGILKNILHFDMESSNFI